MLERRIEPPCLLKPRCLFPAVSLSIKQRVTIIKSTAVYLSCNFRQEYADEIEEHREENRERHLTFF